MLASFTSLRRLHIGNHHRCLPDWVLQKVGYLPNLRLLSLECSDLSKQGAALEAALLALPALTHLDLSHCTLEADDDIEAETCEAVGHVIGDLVGLQQLNTAGTVIPHAALMMMLPMDLAPLVNLQALHTTYAVEGASTLPAFGSLTGLRELGLYWHEDLSSDEMGMWKVAQSLRHLTGLEQLLIEGDNRTDWRGVACLAAALARLTRLQRLQPDGFGRAGDKAIALLLPSLCRLHQLQDLALTGLRMGATGATELAAALGQTSNLVRLDVSNNGFTWASARHLIRQALCVLVRLQAVAILGGNARGTAEKVLELRVLASGGFVSLDGEERW